MADMRRPSPEPPAGAPLIQHKPGLANEMLQELAPLLAEEGIDVNDIDVPDLATLQAAMNRAVERGNMTRFTPVGPAREQAVTTLRLARRFHWTVPAGLWRDVKSAPDLGR